MVKMVSMVLIFEKRNKKKPCEINYIYLINIGIIYTFYMHVIY